MDRQFLLIFLFSFPLPIFSLFSTGLAFQVARSWGYSFEGRKFIKCILPMFIFLSLVFLSILLEITGVDIYKRFFIFFPIAFILLWVNIILTMKFLDYPLNKKTIFQYGLTLSFYLVLFFQGFSSFINFMFVITTSS